MAKVSFQTPDISTERRKHEQLRKRRKLFLFGMRSGRVAASLETQLFIDFFRLHSHVHVLLHAATAGAAPLQYLLRIWQKNSPSGHLTQLNTNIITDLENETSEESEVFSCFSNLFHRVLRFKNQGVHGSQNCHLLQASGKGCLLQACEGHETK